VRDLLRRRMSLVQQRTSLMLSFKSLYTRTTGKEMALSRLKEIEVKEAQELYDHPANQLIAGMQIRHIEQLSESIEKIEKGVLGSARELPYYCKLTTLPGVGRILGKPITIRSGCLGNQPKSNENLNLGARPLASEGVGFEPCWTDWRQPHSCSFSNG
jgi:transposase